MKKEIVLWRFKDEFVIHGLKLGGFEVSVAIQFIGDEFPVTL